MVGNLAWRRRARGLSVVQTCSTCVWQMKSRCWSGRGDLSVDLCRQGGPVDQRLESRWPKWRRSTEGEAKTRTAPWLLTALLLAGCETACRSVFTCRWARAKELKLGWWLGRAKPRIGRWREQARSPRYVMFSKSFTKFAPDLRAGNRIGELYVSIPRSKFEAFEWE